MPHRRPGRIPEEWRARERARLDTAGIPGALPFVVAAVEQLLRHDGAEGELAAAEAGERVLRVVLAPHHAEGALRTDPPLLAAVFQNLDLLYDADVAAVDTIADAVLAVLGSGSP